MMRILLLLLFVHACLSAHVHREDSRKICHWTGKQSHFTALASIDIDRRGVTKITRTRSDFVHLQFVSGSLETLRSDVNGKIQAHIAAPFEIPSRVRFTSSFDANSSLIIVSMSAPDKFEQLVAMNSILWRFWAGDCGLRELGENLTMFYASELFYVAKECVGPTEDIIAPELALPTAAEGPGMAITRLAGFSYLRNSPHVPSLQSACVKHCLSVNTLAEHPKALSVSTLAEHPNASACYLDFDSILSITIKVLVDWSTDFTSDRRHMYSFMRGLWPYADDAVFKAVVDYGASGKSPVNYWVIIGSKMGKGEISLGLLALKKAVLRMSFGDTKRHVLKALRVNTVFAILKSENKLHPAEWSLNAAEMIVDLYEGHEVSFEQVKGGTIKCIIDWCLMAHHKGLSERMCEQGIELSYNAEHLASQLLEQFLIPKFHSVCTIVINPLTLQSSKVPLTDLASPFQKMITDLMATREMLDSETAYILILIICEDIQVSQPHLLLSLLRWLIVNPGHPKSTPFIVQALNRLNQYNSNFIGDLLAVTQNEPEDGPMESLFLFLAQYSPFLLRSKLKTAMVQQHRLYEKGMKLMESIPKLSLRLAGQDEIPKLPLVSKFVSTIIPVAPNLTAYQGSFSILVADSPGSRTDTNRIVYTNGRIAAASVLGYIASPSMLPISIVPEWLVADICQKKDGGGFAQNDDSPIVVFNGNFNADTIQMLTIGPQSDACISKIVPGSHISVPKGAFVIIIDSTMEYVKGEFFKYDFLIKKLLKEGGNAARLLSGQTVNYHGVLATIVL